MAAGWKFTFGDGDARFIAAAMDYIIDRADLRANNVKFEPFDQWASARVKEQAAEIREYIRGVMG
jgi:hypothetical protein